MARRGVSESLQSFCNGQVSQPPTSSFTGSYATQTTSSSALYPFSLCSEARTLDCRCLPNLLQILNITPPSYWPIPLARQPHTLPAMSNYYQSSPYAPASSNQENLQFYQSSYPSGPGGGVSGQTTPFQASYPGGAASSSAYPSTSGGASAYGASPGGFGAFGATGGVSGSIGSQGGLRTGWLAALGTEGYDGEPPLLEELGVNFGHIKMKVSLPCSDSSCERDVG